MINIETLFGGEFQIAYENGRKTADPWLAQIKCKYGHIGLWTPDRLCASVDGYPKIAAQIRRLQCTRVEQDGDFGELTVSFALEDWPSIAEIMKPRRRRKVSLAQRQHLNNIGARTKFSGARRDFAQIPAQTT